MEIFRLRIKPLSGFGSSLLGETLFGQLCWTIRYLQGEDRLKELLEGYLQNRPFAVVSDGFPAGLLPLPNLPGCLWQPSDEDPKKLKAKSWIAVEYLDKPVKQWRDLAVGASDLEKTEQGTFPGLQTHNSINRATSTTGSAEFAPFNMPLNYFASESEFDIYVLFDSSRVSKEELEEAFRTMGETGFGRDATTGLGKFEIKSFEPVAFERKGETVMALSGISLSGLKLKGPNYYKVRTHFGRHGGLLAKSDNPFKAPVVTTLAGAVFTPEQTLEERFIGSGIGGLSKSEPSTVHQGYAIVIGLGSV